MKSKINLLTLIFALGISSGVFANSVPESKSPIACSITEKMNGKPPKCQPGIFRSEGSTKKECETKVRKLCKELCENERSTSPEDPECGCKCGPVEFGSHK